MIKSAIRIIVRVYNKQKKNIIYITAHKYVFKYIYFMSDFFVEN